MLFVLAKALDHARSVCIRLQATEHPRACVRERAVVQVHRVCVARTQPNALRACLLHERGLGVVEMRDAYNGGGRLAIYLLPPCCDIERMPLPP